MCAPLAAAAAINAGDRLSVRVYNHPELTTQVTVDSRGDVALPLAGTLHVAGCESADVAAAIRKRIAPYVPLPAVEVQDASESQILFVSGGPGGVLTYAPNETLSAAVAEIAKGALLGDTAHAPPNATLDRFDQSRLDLKRVTVFRSGAKLGVYDMIALRTTGDPGPVLEANDTIAFANKPVPVNVIGAVNTPGTAYLWPDEPLSDAIVQAGGPSGAAASGHIAVTHADSTREAVALGDEIFNRPAHAGDVITVPTAPRVTVAGLVERPGIVVLQNDFTLVSALASSGGYNKFADLRKVQIVHQGTRTQYDIVALAHGDLSQNPTLHDGDTVFVPEGHKTDWSQVFAALGGIGSFAIGVTHF